MSARRIGPPAAVLADPSQTHTQCTADLTAHRLQVPVITGRPG